MNIDMKYVNDFMIKILNIPSPGGDTEEAIKVVDDEFKKLGIKTWWTKKEALVATIEGEDDEHQKLISAHIDTLGAMVKDIKSNGRLKLSKIGGFSWNSLEGENVIIKTLDDKKYTGTILPEKASVHIHSNEEIAELRTNQNIEVRIDENVKTKEDTLNLGIRVGDFVTFEPRAMITESGYIKSRHLDDKAEVAVVLGVCKYLKENNIKLKYTTHFYISNYEEICHGVSVVPEKTDEFIALDIGTVGIGQQSDEHSVCICAMDSRTPYDFKLRKKLVRLCEKNNINYKVDIHNGYGSDASIGIRQGLDVSFACLGVGVDATHHYERTHVDAVENNIKLLLAYLTE